MMNLIRRWEEYMGPKDERLAADSDRYTKIGYYILLIGTVVCLYYAMMVDQVASTTETAIYTAAGERVFPVWHLIVIVVLISCLVPLALQLRAGILSDRSRYASVDSIPWGYVAMLSLVCATLMGVLTSGMRMIAEIQIVGIEQVTWFGDIAMGVVFFTMAFCVAMFFTAASFKEAIKNRQRLEKELGE